VLLSRFAYFHYVLIHIHICNDHSIQCYEFTSLLLLRNFVHGCHPFLSIQWHPDCVRGSLPLTFALPPLQCAAHDREDELAT
jgi:hypothetical protein